MRFLAFLLALLPAFAFAAPKVMTAEEARAAQQAGEIVLVDIRTPQEWAEGGMPEGAVPLTMQDPEFIPKLQQVLERSNGAPVAMICRTGSRSGYVASRLEEAGLTTIIDVSEGVYGSSKGPGWLKRGLPVEQPDAGTFQERLEALSQ